MYIITNPSIQVGCQKLELHQLALAKVMSMTCTYILEQQNLMLWMVY